MRIVDLTRELADGTQSHPAHPRCVVIEFASRAMIATRCSWSSPRRSERGRWRRWRLLMRQPGCGDSASRFGGEPAHPRLFRGR
jgi:hypothetical protein